jgi:hypothetical protein
MPAITAIPALAEIEDDVGIRRVSRGRRLGDGFEAEIRAGTFWVPVVLRIDFAAARLGPSSAFMVEVLRARDRELASLVGSFH